MGGGRLHAHELWLGSRKKKYLLEQLHLTVNTIPKDGTDLGLVIDLLDADLPHIGKAYKEPNTLQRTLDRNMEYGK